MLLQLFFIFAFVLAQVSPACAFLSGGKSLIEICAADGTSKFIQIGEDFNPVKPEQPVHEVSKFCSFCLLQVQGALAPEALVFLRPPPLGALEGGISASGLDPVLPPHSNAQPRAPPPSIS